MAERSGKIMGNVWISWQNVGNMLKKHRQNETDDGSFVLKRKWNYSRLPSYGSILILMTAIYILSVSKKVLHIISIPITMEWHATINPILHIINNNINNFILTSLLLFLASCCLQGATCVCAGAARHWALSHTPARVVYLSAAAAAVEDSGICVCGGREVHLELLCAPAVNPLCFHFTHTIQCKWESWLAVYPVCLCTVCACRVGDALQAAA